KSVPGMKLYLTSWALAGTTENSSNAAANNRKLLLEIFIFHTSFFTVLQCSGEILWRTHNDQNCQFLQGTHSPGRHGGTTAVVDGGWRRLMQSTLPPAT